MYNPIATYRFQFHQEFTFDDFEKIIPYLQKLGVSTVYASPVFESVPGSTHGYDGVNPHLINPEIGTEEKLVNISKKLKADGLGWLQDIVPNHMGVHPKNLWLMDVLEKGRRSAYASFFDTGLSSSLFSDEQIMMPFLGSSLTDVIQNNELKIVYKNGRLVLSYYDNYCPLSIASYKTILAINDSEGLGNLKNEAEKAESIKDDKKMAAAWDNWLASLDKAYQNNELKLSIVTLIETVNNDKQLLTELAKKQYYRLCSYQETDTKINFRRFFTVNSLMCINIQKPEVFEAYHLLIKQFTDQGIFQGLRIDHIDGLYDPEAYLQNLRELTGDETYIVAEKILEQGEDLPNQWPLQGTSGYDFLAQVNNVLTDSSSAKKFSGFYQTLVNSTESVEKQILQKKAAILKNHMQGELSNLLNYFQKLELADEDTLWDVGADNLRQAIGELLIHCPVYRYYGNKMPLTERELADVRSIIQNIKQAHSQLKPAAELLENILLILPLENKSAFNERVLKFYQRLMQFSGPLMAKGVEDTLMYTYNRFIGHNEVGDAPEAFGIEIKEFHKLMKRRQKEWPLALNATSTHDTKRGEDVRARLNVLTALPDDWLNAVKQWQKLEPAQPIPNANDRYFIYQTIMGAYPMPGQGDDNFAERLSEYLIKSLREGKQNSDWIKPNEAYEKATLDFAAGLLNKQSKFWQTFAGFHQNIADHGIINSLTQLLLKFTCPGVPDVYQGCELWDFSLVDPDNRRPVDYELREQLLLKPQANDPAEQLTQLWENRYNGQIKQWLTQQLFNLRKTESELFAKGDYIPLKVKGTYKDNVIAFVRRYQNKWIAVAAPLYSAAICKEQKTEPVNINWKDTRILLPQEAPANWGNSITDVEFKTTDEELLLSELFNGLPFAILKSEHADNDRGAGILMHITSLPSAFGIGDMGPGAKTFANFLSRCGQKYWQLLPLNPISSAQNYSPYSALCSTAGNTLLISPVLLAKEGLIDEAFLNEMRLPQTDNVNYTEVEDLKQQIFDTAYNTYYQGEFRQLKKSFSDFCQTEKNWLDDFALYLALRDNHDGQPWYEWDEALKTRDEIALNSFKELHVNAIDKIKWLQFIFYRQWHQLRSYCKTLNIKLFGDLPFYVSYDSADVWANQQLFAVDQEGGMTGIAGVPPDYFNADGQLWGMPVYNWPAMKQNGYQWWIERLKKNIDLFDVLRLDHFRAFASYWEVPASQLTAKNGKWVQGPGSDFFETAKKSLGGLPFVAEDLGDIDESVFELRDQFNLPGMKVLQFAFGAEMPQSLYIPHNYDKNFFVYTGTHDNNTILGWYDTDAAKSVINQIADYTGITVKRKNINEVLMRMAYASVANVAIVPMQDILKLDKNSRMNNPSSAGNNWLWRMVPKLVENHTEKDLIKLVKMYNRL